MSSIESAPLVSDPISFPPQRVLDQKKRFYPTSNGGIREVTSGRVATSIHQNEDPVAAKTGAPQASNASGSAHDLNAGLKSLSIQAGLEPFSGNLDDRTARHLLRRTGFGATIEAVAAYDGMNASAAVDLIVDAAINDPQPETPSWANEPMPPENASEAEWMLYNDWTFETLDGYRKDWLKLMPTNGLRERLTMFWHDHFATSQDKYYHVQITQRNTELIRRSVLGDFKQFVSEMGLDPAMLIFLDGVENQVGAPNENYARELCELFTMGITNKNSVNNYSQEDITEIARSLTGYVVVRDFGILYIPQWHDTGEKEVFGQTGNWGYDDIVDIVFAQRQQETAWYICRKLYQEFVYEVPDNTIVQELADLFIANNWDIAVVVRTLLKSAHFFDAQVIGARITSPIEMMIRYYTELSSDRAEDGHFVIAGWASWELEQQLALVPSVNGWPRHRNWISTTSVPTRWDICGWMIWADTDPSDPDNPLQEGRLDIFPTIEALVDVQDPYAVFRIGPALVEHLFSIPIDELDIEELSSGFAGDLVTHPLPDFVVNGPENDRKLAMLFLNPTFPLPWYEFNPNAADDWIYRWFISNVLVRIPEFQLT